MKDSDLTEFCCFLPNISMDQPQVYICISSLDARNCEVTWQGHAYRKEHKIGTMMLSILYTAMVNKHTCLHPVSVCFTNDFVV